MAIAVVVYGHWINAVVAYRDGRLDAGYLVVAVPGMQYLTWVFQVIPLFFLVGGFANAASWRSAQRRGESSATWLLGRGRRLIVPAAALVGCWGVLALALGLAGLDPALIRAGARHALGPLWFLAVYVGVVGAAPLTLRLHDQYGGRAVALLLALAVVTDAARLILEVPVVAWANYAWVWLALHQLGYLWQDGALVRSTRTAWALLAGGAVAFGLLVGPGPYPVSMIDRLNTAPPTVAL